MQKVEPSWCCSDTKQIDEIRTNFYICEWKNNTKMAPPAFPKELVGPPFVTYSPVRARSWVMGLRTGCWVDTLSGGKLYQNS